jgi:hypothetical protein
MPVCVNIHRISIVLMRTWSAKHPDQLRRAAAVITDRDNIAQRAFLVISHRTEYVDKVVGRATTGEDYNAFCSEAAVARLGAWRRCAVIWAKEGLGTGRHGVVGCCFRDDGYRPPGSRWTLIMP